LCDNTGSKAAPFTGQQFRIHTQRFAFHADEEDDESVKMSNRTSCRASGVTPALLAARRRLESAQANNFYSIQRNGFPRRRILQPTENKALHFFYSVQMKSHQSLLTKTRRIP
jgi:hypothetical protein